MPVVDVTYAADGTFQCGRCSHEALSMDSLRRHVQQRHPTHKTYICDVCGTALASRAQLWTHRQKAHSAPMQYLCLPCKLTYATYVCCCVSSCLKLLESYYDSCRFQTAEIMGVENYNFALKFSHNVGFQP